MSPNPWLRLDNKASTKILSNHIFVKIMSHLLNNSVRGKFCPFSSDTGKIQFLKTRSNLGYRFMYLCASGSVDPDFRPIRIRTQKNND